MAAAGTSDDGVGSVAPFTEPGWDARVGGFHCGDEVDVYAVMTRRGASSCLWIQARLRRRHRRSIARSSMTPYTPHSHGFALSFDYRRWVGVVRCGTDEMAGRQRAACGEW
jgi:hypothetical protein